MLNLSTLIISVLSLISLLISLLIIHINKYDYQRYKIAKTFSYFSKKNLMRFSNLKRKVVVNRIKVDKTIKNYLIYKTLCILMLNISSIIIYRNVISNKTWNIIVLLIYINMIYECGQLIIGTINIIQFNIRRKQNGI